MTLEASQVRCPFCNGTNAARAAGNYECEYCLQPFSVQQAQQEESRLTAEIEAWLQQRIGASGVAGGTVDASSRSYIFQHKMLPDIRRDVDRALELLDDYARYPLVQLPVVSDGGEPAAANPLLSSRGKVLGFKGLQARLSSEQVSSFAMSPQDHAAVRAMDVRIADAMHLSNVVEACSTGSAQGFAAARRNLEALAHDTADHLARDADLDPAQRAFSAAMLERFRALSELCEVYEAIMSQNAVSGAAATERLQAIEQRLLQARAEVEGSGHSPAESFPHMMGVQREAEGARAAARWVKAYEAIGGRSGVSFGAFVGEMTSLLGVAAGQPIDGMVDACVEAVRAVRGETMVSVIDDFAWVQGWVERTRQKRTLGFFGAEEEVQAIEELFLPVWLAEVSFSQSSGAVFKQGVEQKRSALVDACAPSPAKTVMLEESSPIARALASQRQLSKPAALPHGSAGEAESALRRAVAAIPQLLNPSLRLRGLRFLPAAIATLSSKKGTRRVAACMNGALPVDDAIVHQLQAMHQLRERFG